MALRTVTMTLFNAADAWERRFDIPVKVGTIVTLDDKHTFMIFRIFTPDISEREECTNWYRLIPIGETLNEYKRQWDKYGTAGKYPDFNFDVDSDWFFSRNVTWEE